MILKFKDKIFIAVVALGILLVLAEKVLHMFGGNNSKEMKNVEIIIKDAVFNAEVVENESDKTKGLGGRQFLPDSDGMLFVHETEDAYVYSMKDMNFDLDFILINEDKIVDLVKNVPKDYSGKIKGGVPYNKVLEINAGLSDRYGIEIGDEVVVKN